MARTATMKIRVLVEYTETETLTGADGPPNLSTKRIEYNKDFVSGTTDGTEIDRVWSSQTALTTSPEDTDLSGALASVLNSSNTVVLTDLVAICTINEQTSTGDAQVGANAAAVAGFVTAASSVVAVKPQGIFLWVAPNGTAVTATTADILRHVASTGTVARKTIIAGRSA